ncbi:LacI family DNA-binding transcriptional regulator [Actinomyces gaoshouyii]|uniref:LacI family transcriptional regulator n=1 Tax=Actinomyces gaoshouyii TaxID=1960083 RepID=A0A8H9HAL9_9ACTO|nr:LacI family DNA-binding transcriptional regulator [Actinomyces gaoshouyii]ARD41046.1 LacI family transcriptional regulator [Actinomyces gaoshouyii]GGO94774.1 LacI family transcriptional regulator [Actinomyces gaoshouyii]
MAGGSRSSGAPSLGDVARLAGVSTQTASRVSMGAGNVRPATRERVLRAMSQLGYSPNRAAQALRRGSFKAIGVLTQQIQRTGEALTTAGVVEEATNAGYAVSLVQVERPESDDMRTAAVRLAHQAIDGLVVVQAGRAGREHLALPPTMPVAVSDSALMGYYPSVSADQAGGVREAISHLLALGHRTVHHVAGPEGSQSALIRRAAWAASLREAGAPTPEPLPGDWSAASGYRAGLRLAADPEVTAVLCANDETALGLIRAMHEQGRAVPADVSVVGFDGLDLGEFSFPPLTTVHQDFKRHGREMVRLVLEQVASGVVDGSRSIIIPTELVLRGSTAPPSARAGEGQTRQGRACAPSV